MGDWGGSRIVRLGDDVRDALGGYAARASWPPGFTIYQRGAQADGVFVVAHGRVLLRTRVRVGRSFIPAIATSGETFGAEGLGSTLRYVTDARADEDAETHFLSAARLRAFTREQPQHAIGLFAQIMAERSALLERLRELTTLSVEQRIVATLLRLAGSRTFTDDAGRVVLCTQRYRLFCEIVGATRESVSMVLGKFVARGLAERDGTTIVVARASELVHHVDAAAVDHETPITSFTDESRQAEGEQAVQ